jgi:hypothetical protein
MNEKLPIRISWPVASQVFLDQLHSSSELKLIVGLHYLASQMPDIEEGPDQNIFNLAPSTANYGPWELAPKWKRIEGENWNDMLRTIGFDTTNAQRLKNALEEKLTKIPINPFPMKHKGEEYTVDLRGINLIVLEKITHAKSGRVKEFNIYLGGYTPILKKWWQAISPSLLFYDEPISTNTWRFIICLGGAIRSQLKLLKKEIRKQGYAPDYWDFSLKMKPLEEKIGIVGQSYERKASTWKEIYKILGFKGIALMEGFIFPKKREKLYGLKPFMKKQAIKWQKSKESSLKTHPGYELSENELYKKKRHLEAMREEDRILFHLTREQLYEWLPLPGLKKKKPTEIEVLNP